MLSDLINEYARKGDTYQLGETAEDAMKSMELSHIYKLNSNENPNGVSPLAVKAMQEAAAKSNYYPEGTGRALREKLADRLGVGADNIVITEGATVAIGLLGEMFLKPGDEVLMPWPTYSGYQKRLIDRNLAVAVKVPLNEDMTLNFEALLGAITERTKLVIICNPNNPTGIACDPAALLKFAQRLPKRVILMVDEAYIQFAQNPDARSMVRYLNEFKNMVVIQTFSKLYGLAGARVGYAVACYEMIEYYQRTVNYFCASGVALAGAEAALDDEEFRNSTLEHNEAGRGYLTEELKKLGFSPFPSSTNFVCCDMGIDPMEITEKLRKKGVLIRGNLGFPRITVGTSEANQVLIETLTAILNRQSGG